MCGLLFFILCERRATWKYMLHELHSLCMIPGNENKSHMYKNVFSLSEVYLSLTISSRRRLLPWVVKRKGCRIEKWTRCRPACSSVVYPVTTMIFVLACISNSSKLSWKQVIVLPDFSCKHQLKLAWWYRPCILHLLCRKALVLSAEFGTKIKFDLSTFIQKLLVFIKNYLMIHRSDKMKAIFHTLKFWYRENLAKAKLDTLTQNGVTP